MNYKIENIKKKMEKLNIQGMIITNPSSLRYVLGFDVEGMIFITDKGNLLITDSRYIEYANSMITITDGIATANISELTDDDNFSFFEDCERVGFEEFDLTYSSYSEMIRRYRISDMVETNGLIEKLRMIKDNDEISYIEKACNITDNCFEYLKKFIKIGMTEKEIALEIYNYFIKHGADGLAFDTIVASGTNSSKPHAIPTDKKIEYGDIIVIDFGAKYNGYCADMTRTIFVGEVNKEAEKLYNFLFEVQANSTRKFLEGEDTKVIAKSVEYDLNQKNCTLIHALGHGVGIDIHEKPILSVKSSSILKNNMVVTNEPGIYIPGDIGIRIEDTVVINGRIPRILTNSSKQLTVIDG
ncbi:MAG: aminopeptidase P family protein [Clostridiales bacterium]|nr:aminopeptidase P family protein [Clostridiales bacterium]